jgi:hypothetical protein
LVRTLLTRAACSRLASDDLVQRFIEWIDSYNELHFRVIRCVHARPHSTRLEIWQELYGRATREDSAEADLFKLLIRDLSTGGVLRQYRARDDSGHFVKRPRRSATSARSAFDAREPYVLTELGERFVSYALPV